MLRIVWFIVAALLFPSLTSAQNIYTLRARDIAFYEYLEQHSPTTLINPDSSGLGDDFLFLDQWLGPASLYGGDLPAAQRVITDYIVELQQGRGSLRTAAVGGDWAQVGHYGVTPVGFDARVEFISFAPQSPNLILTGSPVGGLYYSDNGGASWKNGGMDQLPQTSVSQCIVHPTNSDVWYCATGDNAAHPTIDTIHNNAAGYDPEWNQSFGVYCTTNRGASWSFIGLNQAFWGWDIYELSFKPDDPTVIYAATSAGVWQATNATCNPSGVTWKQLSFAPAANNQDVFNVTFQPGSSQHMYASGQIMDSNGQRVILESSNAGASWSPIGGTSSFLTNQLLRVTMAVTQGNPDLLYAVVINTDQAYLWRFNVSTQHWTAKGPVTNTGSYSLPSGVLPSQAGTIGVSPTQPGLVYIGCITAARCLNADQGGNCNWQSIQTGSIHADGRQFRFTPDGATIWAATDGGVFKSTPSNTPWVAANDGLALATILGFATYPSDSDIMLLGLYDNGAHRTLNAGLTWSFGIYGDGLQPMIDYTNVDNMYESVWNGSMYRSADKGQSFPYNAAPCPPCGNGDFHTFSVLDSATPSTFYAASFPQIYRTTDMGATFTRISTFANSTDIWRIYTAQSDANTLYAWSLEVLPNDSAIGHFYKTKNAHAAIPTWTEFTPLPGPPCSPGGGLPVFPAGLAVDPNNADIITLAYAGYCGQSRVFHYDPMKCPTWCNWDPNPGVTTPAIPLDSLVGQGQGTQGYIFAGSRAGVYFRTNTSNWTQLGNKLPHTQVSFLDVECLAQPPRVRAFTFGRGVWETPYTCQ